MTSPKLMALLAVVMTATPQAIAQDDLNYNFNGFHVGVEGGFQRNKAEGVAPNGVSIDDRNGGYNLRAFAGSDWRVSENFVLGVEGGLSLGGPTVKGSENGVTLNADPGLTLDVSGRAGFLATEDLLFYGRAGYGLSKINSTRATTGQTASSINRDSRLSGILLGAGAEYQVSDALRMRVEYRRQKLGSNFTSNAVMAGLAYQF